MYEQVEEESIRKGNVSERQAQFKQKSLYISLRSKRSNRVIARKLERKQKKGWRGRGRGEEETLARKPLYYSNDIKIQEIQ